MKYMLLIYAEEAERDDLTSTPEGQDAEMKRWIDYTADLQAAGVMIAGDPLQRIATATTVRVRDGQRSVTDGPFAETKEVLGGYYLLDVDSLDDAIGWAEQCPAAEFGSVELRPLMDFPAT